MASCIGCGREVNPDAENVAVMPAGYAHLHRCLKWTSVDGVDARDDPENAADAGQSDMGAFD